MKFSINYFSKIILSKKRKKKKKKQNYMSDLGDVGKPKTQKPFET